MTTVSSAVPTHGNYHNYHGYVPVSTSPRAKYNIPTRYRYHHPGGHDSRLALLPRELLANARVLDVGCNEGWVSCEIGTSLASPPLSLAATLTSSCRTAQRSCGVLDASLAWISTTRSCAWPGGADARSGVTKLPSPTSLHPLAPTLPVANVNVRHARRRRRHQDRPITFPRRASTCLVLFLSLLRILLHSTWAFRTVNSRTTCPSAALTG